MLGSHSALISPAAVANRGSEPVSKAEPKQMNCSDWPGFIAPLSSDNPVHDARLLHPTLLRNRALTDRACRRISTDRYTAAEKQVCRSQNQHSFLECV